MIRDIAGRQNHSIKLARKLQKKKFRREHSLIVCEGMDLLRAAVAGGADVREVLVRRDLVSELPREVGEAGVDVGVCAQETLDHAGSLGGAADVVFMCAQPLWGLNDLELEGRVTFYVDGAGDPGNVGTIVRSGAAFGLAGVICAPQTADPFGPKAMRAGMGAQFALPVVTEVSAEDLAAGFAAMRTRGKLPPEVWVADPHGGTDIRELVVGEGAVVVLGAERTGPGSQWGEATRVTIPQCRLDSLNVAMAGTIMAYETSRPPRRP